MVRPLVIRSFLGRYPRTTVTALVAGSATATAFGVEYQAKKQEQDELLRRKQQWQHHQHQNKVDQHEISTMSSSLLSVMDSSNGKASTLRSPSHETSILPRAYDWHALNQYWLHRPVTVATRLVHILHELGPIVATWYWQDLGGHANQMELSHSELDNNDQAMTQHHQHQQDALRTWAAQLREALTNLGPCFIKAGQQLSIRPDLVPPSVLQELSSLCDAVRPIPDHVALQSLQQEWNMTAAEVNDTFGPLQLVAAASLGQVYKATIRSPTGQREQHVAIKVQRPDMLRAFSLDLFLLQRFSILVDTFTGLFTQQPPFHQALYESFARGSYQELDYQHEAASQHRFATELKARAVPVQIPAVFDEFTTQRVLVTEWIDGIKLADAPREQIRQLIPVGVELFLTQLLDIGAFHADPHPGNLLVNEQGKLCLIDFGLCAEVDPRARRAMTKAIIHLLVRDFTTLIQQDAAELGFLPADFDTTELQPILIKILTVGLLNNPTSNLRQRKRHLQQISNELNHIFFQYPFTVPPFFALVTRGLGLLEGIALTGDPDFDIFQASAPYARRRARQMMLNPNRIRSGNTRTSFNADSVMVTDSLVQVATDP